VLTNKEEGGRLGGEGRRRVEQLFTTAIVIERTTDLYRSLLARRQGHLVPGPARDR
jgi:hypothetical protein